MTISDVAAPAAPVSDVAATRRRAGADQTREQRSARIRHYAMTPPTFFAVEYAINPWMDTSTPVDTHLAMNQWESLRQTYKELGHTVELVEPRRRAAGHGVRRQRRPAGQRQGRRRPVRLPAARGRSRGLRRVDGPPRVSPHRDAARQRRPGRPARRRARSCWRATDSAPTGVRTTRSPPPSGCRVVSLELVDPRFYHLDTALAVLDDTTIAYYPPAFSDESRTRLLELFPDAIEVATPDAYVLGLNAVSDGSQRRPPGGRNRLRRAALRCRVHADRRRPVGAAQGRRISQMLHAGGVFVTILDTVTAPDHRRDRPRRSLRRAQLLAAARRRGQRRGRLDHRRRGPALPGLPGRLFGGELRAPQPRDHRRRTRAARRRDAGQPGVPLRPARAVLRRRWPSCAARTWCCR